MENGRLVGIDYGTKRVGVAVSDPLCIFASPFGTFSPDEIIPLLQDMVERDGLKGIVIGWPLTESGETGRAIRRVENFANTIRKALPGIPVITWDERYSSQKAQRYLIDSGIGKKARMAKARLDRAAAAVILQEYLDSEDVRGDDSRDI